MLFLLKTIELFSEFIIIDVYIVFGATLYECGII